MGEYATLDGVEMKLGTCDAMYYVRREELVGASFGHVEANGQKSDYVKASGIFWRFPWIAEDGQTAQEWAQRDTYPKHSPALYAHGIEVEHGKKVVYCQAPGGGHQLNMTVPCPLEIVRMGDDAPACITLSSGIGSQGHREILVPKSQRWWSEEREYTVCECAYCGHPQAFSEPEISLIRELNREHLGDKFVSRLKGDPVRTAEAQKAAA